MCRPSSFLAPRSVLHLPAARDCSPSDSDGKMTVEEEQWVRNYKERLQHIMAHMNHHIHPLVNPDTGERRPLRSCIPKGKTSGCRSNFPLDVEMCKQPMLVCPCIASKQNLPVSGPRSYIGCVLSARNSPWLNAGPAAWMVFSGDNGDIKFPHRLPVMAETHEKEQARTRTNIKYMTKR